MEERLTTACSKIFDEHIDPLDCPGDVEPRADAIAECVAEADQLEGKCSEEYLADLECRAGLQASDYECVGIENEERASAKLGTCEDTFVALADCVDPR